MRKNTNFKKGVNITAFIIFLLCMITVCSAIDPNINPNPNPNPAPAPVASDVLKVYELNYSWLDENNSIINTTNSATPLQAAITVAHEYNTIYVQPGLYEEDIIINKPLTILGATYDEEKDDDYEVPVNYTWDTTVESVIRSPNPQTDGITVDITNTNDVIFKGFVVENLYTNTNNRHLLRVNADNTNVNNITVQNNVIGPNTNLNDTLNKGRMGLYIVPHYGQYSITNSTFSRNKIFDSGGNGNNIFIWGTYSGNPVADLSGTVIEYNDIYGSRRSGIEIAGATKNFIIRNNNIYDNGAEGDDAEGSKYKYGNGITLIRIGSEKYINNVLLIQNITICNNSIYNNKKFGIYAGPFIKDLLIQNNVFENNNWDDLQIDLEENYHGGVSPVYNITSNITFTENNLDEFTRLTINGVPTNNFVLNATHCYWGTNKYEEIIEDIYGSVEILPYYTSKNMKNLVRYSDKINYEFTTISEICEEKDYENNLDDVDTTNYQNFSNLYFKNDYGKITITEPLNLSAITFKGKLKNIDTSLIKIEEQKIILLNNSEFENKSANIEFYNVDETTYSIYSMNSTEILSKMAVILQNGTLVQDERRGISNISTNEEEKDDPLKFTMEKLNTVLIDIEPPVITGKIRPNGINTTGTNVNLSCKLSDNILVNNDSLKVSVEGCETWDIVNRKCKNHWINFTSNKTTGSYKVSFEVLDIFGNKGYENLTFNVLNATIKEKLCNINLSSDVWGDIENETSDIKVNNYTAYNTTVIKFKGKNAGKSTGNNTNKGKCNKTLVIPNLQNVSINITNETLQNMDKVAEVASIMNYTNITNQSQMENITRDLKNNITVILNAGFNISNITTETVKEEKEFKSKLTIVANNTTSKGFLILQVPKGNLDIDGVYATQNGSKTELLLNDIGNELGWYTIIDNNTIEITVVQDPEIDIIFKKLIDSIIPDPEPPQPSSIYHSNRGSSGVSDVSSQQLQLSKMVASFMNDAIVVAGSEVDVGYGKYLKSTVCRTQGMSVANITVNSDMVIVGGPVVNLYAKTYQNRFAEQITNEYPGVGKGYIQIQKINNYTVYYIAGSDRTGTKVALDYFTQMDTKPSLPLLVERYEDTYKITY
ncbi:right-handed parallel beta-helix repeat-containing protein [Methanococcus voltae]|uniref:Right handed beta helix domain-containing protein n=1 Tax=Methanococcus voltae (strain ATCC BAA-1334 / A3) TaxID=456320 RepID=D7DTD2_METV3|nr:right-handed parallel beta-helix repeat-containing protein [Methanococcus voltae]MCS3901243.1 hypothetical protein [Methanococcus voltae]